MSSSDNKKLMQEIFQALSVGNDQPFIDAMAEEMKWVWMGSGRWAKTFDGKAQVLGELWSAVRQTLKPPYKVYADNFIADGAYVTVEAVGQNSTPDGLAYQNKYCWVCRIADGKIHELKEYMDTELVTKTFAEPPVVIMGKQFLFDFGANKALITYINKEMLEFTITELAGKPHQETERVQITLTEIRSNVYMVSWKEKNGNTETQIQDFEFNRVHSNWTLPSGEFANVTGTIRPQSQN